MLPMGQSARGCLNPHAIGTRKQRKIKIYERDCKEK